MRDAKDMEIKEIYVFGDVELVLIRLEIFTKPNILG
jgi:hypothetical protein